MRVLLEDSPSVGDHEETSCLSSLVRRLLLPGEVRSHMEVRLQTKEARLLCQVMDVDTRKLIDGISVQVQADMECLV